MGVVLKLVKIEDATKNLEEQIENSTEIVDLYKCYTDVLIVLGNVIFPDELDFDNLIRTSVYGKLKMETFKKFNLVGLNSTEIVIQCCEHLNKMNINTLNKFEEYYNNLDSEVLEELKGLGSPKPSELFEAYIEPMLTLYNNVKENSGAIGMITIG